MKPSTSAVLRCDGTFVISGRASFVWETFLLRRVAAIPGAYEIRGPSKKWHKLDWTPEQATEMLLDWGFTGKKRVASMKKLRERRAARNLPVG